MSLKTILFDLDGTLLPMDQDTFVKAYFGGIARHMAPLGWDVDKLLDTIWHSTDAMYKNDGTRTNEEVFWDYFCSVFGPESRSAEPLFNEYYEKHFCKVKEVCGFEPAAARTVRTLKAMGLRVVLATNPLFPAVCTHQRLSWTGLQPEEFDLITVYENSSFSKPDPRYFSEILEKLGEAPENCLMVGNDATEDTCGDAIGLPCFLITADLLNRRNKDISAYPQGTFEDLLDFVKERM